MIININKRNIGYGGNIKKCLYYAIKNNFSHAVMIHGDNQYDVRYITALYKKIKKDYTFLFTYSIYLYTPLYIAIIYNYNFEEQL